VSVGALEVVALAIAHAVDRDIAPGQRIVNLQQPGRDAQLRIPVAPGTRNRQVGESCGLGLQAGIQEELAQGFAVQLTERRKPRAPTDGGRDLPGLAREPAHRDVPGPGIQVLLRRTPAGLRRGRAVVSDRGRYLQVSAGHRVDFCSEAVDVLLKFLRGAGRARQDVGIRLPVLRELRIPDQPDVHVRE
jgi:hypothetical protein